MARYHVQSPHTPEQCLQTLDAYMDMGPDKLRIWDFACAAGDHTQHIAFAVLEAPDQAAARNIVPEHTRDRLQMTEVAKQTPEHIRSFHQAA